MVKRWDQFRNPWDREYAMRGPLWRGVASASHLEPFVPKGETVLDLGCGDGKFLAGLAEAAYRPLGVDSSRHALSAARERGPWPTVRADVRRLPFQQGSFGAIAARYILGAIREQGRASAAMEIARLLRPNGVVLVEEFSTEDFRAGVGRRVEERTFERNRGILTHYFERDEIPLLFPGFVVLNTETIESRQRTDEGTKTRHRWRWVLRR